MSSEFFRKYIDILAEAEDHDLLVELHVKQDMRLDEVLKLDPTREIKFDRKYLGDGDQRWYHYANQMTVILNFSYLNDEDEDDGGKTIVDVSADMGSTSNNLNRAAAAAVEFFGIVLAGLNQFIREEQPNRLTFSAPNSSRTKLYQRMIRQNMANIRGYQMTDTHSYVDNGNIATDFVLDKVG